MFVTKEEQLQGWKSVPVITRAGDEMTLTVSAPTREQYRSVQQRLAADKELNEVSLLTQLSLGEQAPWIDKIDPTSANIIEATVIEFTYGSGFMERLKTKAEETRPKAPAPVTTP
jgi:hypothetical protein